MDSQVFVKQISDSLLAKIAEFVYQRTGIRLSPQKKALLSNRLRRRMRQTGHSSFEAYFKHVQSIGEDHPEWDAFLQEINTHETFLFRDEVHWEWFQNQFLDQLAKDARSGRRPRKLHIWSAACSTGDEPVTLACCIAAKLPNAHLWNIRILGTDIGTGALEQARKATFGIRAMGRVPEEYRRRYFTQVDEEHWQAKPLLTRWITYKQHNLVEPMREGPFDLVVLKNVLIYFDVESKKVVLEHVIQSMHPGAYLLTGAAEGIANIRGSLKRVYPWLFQKPEK